MEKETGGEVWVPMVDEAWHHHLRGEGRGRVAEVITVEWFWGASS